MGASGLWAFGCNEGVLMRYPGCVVGVMTVDVQSDCGKVHHVRMDVLHDYNTMFHTFVNMF